MLQRQVPVSLFTVLLAILVLAASVLIAGCQGSDKRLTVGGQEAADLANDDDTAAPAQGAGTAATGQAAGTAPGGGGGMRGGMGGGGMRGGGMGGGMGGGGMRGGMGGGGMRGGMGGGGAAGGAAQTAAAPGASEPAAPVHERPVLTDVEVAEKVEEFASLFGPVSRVKEQYWNEKTTDWLIFTYTGENRSAKGRKIKLPLSMIEDAEDQSVLEGYFPIYVVSGLRPSGKVISRQEISVPKITIAAYKEQYAVKAAAAKEAAAEETAAASEADATAEGAAAEPAAASTQAPPAGGGRMGGGGMGGGMGGRRGGRMGQ